jgi:hypothetical protein
MDISMIPDTTTRTKAMENSGALFKIIQKALNHADTEDSEKPAKTRRE